MPAGQGFYVDATLNIADPVNCQGRIAGLGYSNINLQNGLVLSGSGSIGANSLVVNDPNSGMSGGSLVLTNQTISASGTFSQSGGGNSLITLFDSGSYVLSGTGSLATDTTGHQYVGYAANGLFAQSGGSNLFYQGLYIGYNGYSGQYILSGGQLTIGPYSGAHRVCRRDGPRLVRADRRQQLHQRRARAGQRGRQRRPTRSAARASCRCSSSTWAMPARASLRSPAAPTWRPTPSILATSPAATERTTSTAGSSRSCR